VESKKYFFITFNRQENVDYKKNFENILKGVELVYRNLGLTFIFPICPKK